MEESTPQQQDLAAFQEGVNEIIMSCEELRQPFKQKLETIPVEILVNGREDLDLIFQNLGGMHDTLTKAKLRQPLPGDESSQSDEMKMQQDLFEYCQSRVSQVARLILDRVFESSEPKEDEKIREKDEHEQQEARQQLEMDRRDFQASVARITELNLIFCLETRSDKNIQEVVAGYVAYQRNMIRERAKPSIARLVQERKNRATNPILECIPHSNVVTIILGQASALIHPLLVWLFSLPPPPPPEQVEVNKLVAAIRELCQKSVATLDEQAQTLTKTVSDWFWVDRKVDEWMEKSNHPEQDFEDENHKLYLGELDSLVEEMAFVCQVLARYHSMIKDVPFNLQPIVEKELSPEWTWKYASLERFLAMQQWKSAMILACPVSIVLGTSIQVPSVVEDAQYLSTRALERAASTRSVQAIGTVAHSISSHVWSTDVPGGVHQALTDQIGCYKEETERDQPKDKSPPRTNASSNSFASALLDALDDDIGPSGSSKARSKPPRPPTSGPNSGGIFQSLVGGGEAFQQIRMNSDFCNLNGIHSASASCQSLVKYLDGLLENLETADAASTEASAQQMNAMIQLAREELSQYGHAYDQMLSAKVQSIIVQYCGDLHDPPKQKNGLCVPALRYHFLAENCELDPGTFKEAESDARLERVLLGPLNDSKFLIQTHDKCEAEVVSLIRAELTQVLAELALECFLHADPPKRVSDWGALLLSKEVRLLHGFLSQLQDKTSSSAQGCQQTRKKAANSETAWEKLNEVVAVLQLERPSDWTLYQSTTVLSPDELQSAMHLRVDFSADAINAVLGNR